ncbi:MAG TPA: hypothetical protein VHB99_10545 [Pirellulales bacterium]|nr:hypothetical protein [Pirellulales bacterium]
MGYACLGASLLACIALFIAPAWYGVSQASLLQACRTANFMHWALLAGFAVGEVASAVFVIGKKTPANEALIWLAVALPAFFAGVYLLALTVYGYRLHQVLRRYWQARQGFDRPDETHDIDAALRRNGWLQRLFFRLRGERFDEVVRDLASWSAGSEQVSRLS